MKDPNSPFRYLAKTYSDELISREHYVSVRAQLLKRLESKGIVGDEDLQDFIRLAKGEDQPVTQKTYTSSDWIIIVLGIVAALVLGYVLYG